MERNLRSNTQIDFIGFEQYQILGSKLPTCKEVLQVFFHNTRTLKLTVQVASNLAVDEAILFWEKAKIPIKEKHRCAEKLKKLYEEWRNIKKNSSRKTESQKKKESEFETKINRLFDIAHSNADKMLSKEGQMFLHNQRSDKREGGLGGVDRKAVQKEQRRCDRIDKETERKRRYEESEMLKHKGKIYNHFLLRLQYTHIDHFELLNIEYNANRNSRSIR